MLGLSHEGISFGRPIERRITMLHGSSDQVRAVALEKYLEPALRAGRKQVSVAVRDVLEDLVTRGFPPANIPQICTALKKQAFLRQHGIEIDHIEGPPSKMSPTVVFHYRVANPDRNGATREKPAEKKQSESGEEDPSARAYRLTEKLRGLLKEELAAYGGGEAFLRWIRSEDEDAA
jgi:hypothetical protein